MKISLIILFSTLLFFCSQAQNVNGQWHRTIQQIERMKVDETLVGEWHSTVNDPFLSFTLSEDKTFRWNADSMNLDLPDSSRWTKPIARWVTIGGNFYIFAPNEEKNKWDYNILGAYSLKEDKLYLGICFKDRARTERIVKIKSKGWKGKNDNCVHKLVRGD